MKNGMKPDTWIRIVVFCAVLLITSSIPLAASEGLLGDLGDTPEEELAAISSVLSRTSLQPGGTYDAAVIVTVEKDWHINSAHPFQDWLIPAELQIDTVDGFIPSDIIYPKPEGIFLLGENMSVYHGRFSVHFKINVDQNITEGNYSLPVRFTYQACNDRECRAAQTIQDALEIVVGDEGQAINEDIFAGELPPSSDMETGAVSREQESDLQHLIDKYGFWGYFIALGLAFLTGLLLSFSPCTYPMIPITVSVFAGQDRKIGRGFVLSLFYVGSMAVMYGIMGLIVSLVGGIFGAWLASPAVVIGIAVVFVIFALSMFGLYELQVPYSWRQKLGAKQSGGGVVGSIVLGIVAALVISPCVGPFVAGILLYIATYGSPVFGFLTLFIFAIGLGTLYIIIATFSSAISALPGAGTWMESVKRFFGFVLLFMALYFLRTIISPSLTAVIGGLILIAFAVFGGGFDRLTPEDKFFARLKKFVGVLAFVVGVYLLLGAMLSEGFLLPEGTKIFSSSGQTMEQSEKKLIPWKTDLEAGLIQAKNEGKPVLIDTWATWCVNCRVLDKKTFGNADVAAEAKRFLPLKIQLETAGSDETKEFMARFGLRHYSLPTTLLIDSKGTVKKILRGVVGPDEMIAEMRKIR